MILYNIKGERKSLSGFQAVLLCGYHNNSVPVVLVTSVSEAVPSQNAGSSPLALFKLQSFFVAQKKNSLDAKNFVQQYKSAGYHVDMQKVPRKSTAKPLNFPWLSLSGGGGGGLGGEKTEIIQSVSYPKSASVLYFMAFHVPI